MRFVVPPRVLILAIAALTPGSANSSGTATTDGQCSRLVLDGRPGLEILSAIRVQSGSVTAADDQQIEVPASCRILGVARPTADSEIQFELWLPDGWNGRYSQLGNGGFAGNIDHPSLAAEMRRGNATAMTDTGHKASQFDASWALGHPQKIVDYGYRSIKVTADAATLLIEDYYGRPAHRRYFIGCSNGGRQALMAAQRYPDDWDGILAGSPAVSWTRQLATFAAIQHRLRIRPENWIPARKLPAIARVAATACPEAAGQARECRLDVSKLVCRGEDAPNCLTAVQATTLDLIQTGLPGPDGQSHTGFAPTAAALPRNWDQWILNRDRNAPGELAFATQAFRYLVFDRPDWQIEHFDPTTDPARLSARVIAGERLSAILDADDTDLRRFARHGGKIIMYVGWSDALISPAAGAAYYRQVQQRFGPARTRSFFRLFVAPGMQHCQGGLEPNAFGQAWVAPGLGTDPRHDIRSALEAWIERGQPPISLVAAKYEGDYGAGRLISTQQLRPYPQPADAIANVR